MSREQAVRTWLRARGAETVAHPGGTLYAHLGRVHDRLAALGHPPQVALAGLAHAAYGTDGFDLTLLDVAFAPQHAAYFRTLVKAWAQLVSPAVLAEARKALAR
jgi:hypothetical protein